jgi:hypothetical protein
MKNAEILDAFGELSASVSRFVTGEVLTELRAQYKTWLEMQAFLEEGQLFRAVFIYLHTEKGAELLSDLKARTDRTDPAAYDKLVNKHKNLVAAFVRFLGGEIGLRGFLRELADRYRVMHFSNNSEVLRFKICSKPAVISAPETLPTEQDSIVLDPVVPAGSSVAQMVSGMGIGAGAELLSAEVLTNQYSVTSVDEFKALQVAFNKAIDRKQAKLSALLNANRNETRKGWEAFCEQVSKLIDELNNFNYQVEDFRAELADIDLNSSELKPLRDKAFQSIKKSFVLWMQFSNALDDYRDWDLPSKEIYQSLIASLQRTDEMVLDNFAEERALRPGEAMQLQGSGLLGVLERVVFESSKTILDQAWVQAMSYVLPGYAKAKVSDGGKKFGLEMLLAVLPESYVVEDSRYPLNLNDAKVLKKLYETGLDLRSLAEIQEKNASLLFWCELLAEESIFPNYHWFAAKVFPLFKSVQERGLRGRLPEEVRLACSVAMEQVERYAALLDEKKFAEVVMNAAPELVHLAAHRTGDSSAQLSIPVLRHKGKGKAYPGRDFLAACYEQEFVSAFNNFKQDVLSYEDLVRRGIAADQFVLLFEDILKQFKNLLSIQKRHGLVGYQALNLFVAFCVFQRLLSCFAKRRSAVVDVALCRARVLSLYSDKSLQLKALSMKVREQVLLIYFLLKEVAKSRQSVFQAYKAVIAGKANEMGAHFAKLSRAFKFFVKFYRWFLSIKPVKSLSTLISDLLEPRLEKSLLTLIDKCGGFDTSDYPALNNFLRRMARLLKKKQSVKRKVAEALLDLSESEEVQQTRKGFNPAPSSNSVSFFADKKRVETGLIVSGIDMEPKLVEEGSILRGEVKDDPLFADVSNIVSDVTKRF